MINGWKQEPVKRADELFVHGNKAQAARKSVRSA
jgi:hypothetical protein